MKKGINKYLGAFVMGTALMAVPSCTDTWNEHYQPQDGTTATETLWELLESHEDLSKFRGIVEKAKYYRDETHPAFTLNGLDTVFYTFKDVMNSNTPITIWAPVNSALTEEEWKKYEDMAKTDGYNLQQQFIGNHIALYRKSMSKTGKETIRLINSKFAVVDFAKNLFQESQVTKNDIPARNGLLHKLESRNEFFYNLYEYIKFSGDFPKFRDYLVQRDTIYFLEGSSIEGLPDEDGNPTYVDSVYFQDNLMFGRSAYNPVGFGLDAMDAEDAWMNNLKMFNALVNIEDSSYVMVIPTDAAWTAAAEKMKPYYNYGAGEYPRMSKVKVNASKGSSIDIKGARRAFSNGKGYETVDSLQAVNIDMDIIDPLVFNVNLQPQKNGKAWTKETFINGGYKECDYLLTTRGDTIRNVYEVIDGVKTLVWNKDALFESGSKKQMSNGYAIVSNSWNYPQSFWMRDVDVEAGLSSIYDNSTSTNFNSHDINTKLWENNVYGRCSENRYLSVTGRTPSTRPEIAFRLNGCKQGTADVMSAKYDVMVVLVPWWFNTSDEVAPDLPETEEKTAKSRVKCTLYAWSADKVGNKDLSYKKQEKLGEYVIDYQGHKVDTITIMTDVEFPLSYKNLNDAYPVLQFASERINKADEKKGYQNSFNIDQIILKCKE